MVNLLCHPFLVGEMVPMETGNRKPAKTKSASEDTDALQSKIELRYRHQQYLLACVEKGDKEGALRIFQLTRFNPSDRVPNNPLRAHKNISLSFNTMLRMAAERGKVGPFFLHETSDRYARLIERINNISELEALLTTMIAEYCDLVRKSSTRGTSPPVRKAINHILIHFASPLSLDEIADKVNLNPSHLSRQFRKETGLTVTDYINRKRIDEARILIDQGNRSISDIASAVGFESQTYFTTVFKRMNGQTPSQYIKSPNIDTGWKGRD
jgi:AraC-like DNA-binding protein